MLLLHCEQRSPDGESLREPTGTLVAERLLATRDVLGLRVWFRHRAVGELAHTGGEIREVDRAVNEREGLDLQQRVADARVADAVLRGHLDEFLRLVRRDEFALEERGAVLERPGSVGVRVV